MENELIIHNVSKTSATGSYILNNINLALPRGSRLSVLGPSGSGKTTLLRMIAGLDTPDSGDIRFNGVSILDLPPHKRNFGMMFQDYALFPHLDVFANIAFGLKMKGMSKRDQAPIVEQMLSLTNLKGFENRKVDELSGGERQRVALARTLAPGPRLLMLDEPLSALDRVLRKHLLDQLTQILSRLHITTIFVTHDHEEAFAAGAQIILMNQGKIVQQGSPDQLIHHPVNDWIKSFMA
ncbi:ABC transporter ATP-binding protein [Desulfobacter hydrogenophilus]|uniref:ABC transporter ATP-binding protein n=1 Tax=Desulfobacter hydrogenophilus TaxID=2291 RepID=A0A328FGH3_9BACT|nr:ABC transporter ATP-binding protein [Desulfobacter hydrogenophilus]NDY71539.1 ABC transporter ATP-binding protein [Desulfobacter hydrogenophilus]QBH11922.1 ABC transporter ATP-binding protein [Desulfobacter hydrogenophilus]RAM02562.1 ABC transporter ATP-binding protein [Desulfobacter hydrogenophilus]